MTELTKDTITHAWEIYDWAVENGYTVKEAIKMARVVWPEFEIETK